MTRSDLIRKLTDDQNNIPVKVIEDAVRQVFNYMAKSLVEGQRIEIRGFGSFQVRERNSRKARNPKTGETVEISSKRTVYFKPGKELKEKVNKDVNESIISISEN